MPWSEYYPVGSKHLRNKSGKSPIECKRSVAGRAMLSKLTGDSYQRQLSGKNLLNPSALTEATKNGVTFTPVFNKDGTLAYINANGTSTQDVYYPAGYVGADKIKLSFVPTIGESYKCSGGYNDGNGTVQFYFNGFNGDTTWHSTPVYNAIATTEDPIYAALYIASGVTVTDLKIYPMITLATEVDQTYEPYCGGVAAPNPDYPQEIESIGVKNLLPITAVSGTVDGVTYTVNDDGSITANGTGKIDGLTASSIFPISTITLPAGTYMLTGKPEGNENTGIYAYTDSGIINSPFTLSSETEVTVKLDVYGGPHENIVFYPMIRKCDTNGDPIGSDVYTPYGHGEVTVKSVGKNLFKFSTNTSVVGMTITSTEEELNYSGTTTGTLARSAGGVALSSGTYEVTVNKLPPTGMTYILQYTTDGSIYTRVHAFTPSDTSLTATFDLPSDQKVIFTLYGSGTFNENGVRCSIHKVDDIKRIAIPLSAPLRAIGDVKDEICIQDGQYGVLRRIGNIDISADTVWSPTTTAKASWFPTGVSSPFARNLPVYRLLCNKYRSAKLRTSSNATPVFDNPGVTTADEMKVLIGECYIEGPLATPVFEPFEDQSIFLELTSAEERTFISVENISDNLSPELNVFYPGSEESANIMEVLVRLGAASVE